MLQEGSKAPGFSLPDDRGRTVSLSEYAGKKSVVLFFFPKANTKFREKFDLTMPLLCDTDKKVAQAYGVYKEKNMYGKKVMGLERTTFIIGKDGVVRKIFPKVTVEGHIEEVLRALDLQASSAPSQASE